MAEKSPASKKSRNPWLSIVLTGLLSFVISMIVVAGTIAGYAFILAVKAKGPPDQSKIETFANSVVPFLGPAVLVLLVLLAAWWVVRRARSTQRWHGVMVGVVAALPTLMFLRRPDPGDLIGLVLPPVAGLMGAWLGRSRATDQTAIADATRRNDELSSGQVTPRTHEEVMEAARRALPNAP